MCESMSKTALNAIFDFVILSFEDMSAPGVGVL